MVRWPAPPDEDRIERLLAELDEYGVTAVDEAGGATRLFFSATDARDRAAGRCRAVEPSATCERLEVSDENWAERSQASITAVRVGDLVIAPPWHVPADGPPVIVIQPSMGFGTAHHESTRLCLRLLQATLTRGVSALDVGTGSGVLAIAAHTLGAAPVVAADDDPDAVESARENLALNHAERAITLRQLDLAEPSVLAGQQFGVVLANLSGGLLTRYAETLAAFVAPGGSLITSGFTLDEEHAVTAAMAAHGLAASRREVEHEWLGISWLRANGVPPRCEC